MTAGLLSVPQLQLDSDLPPTMQDQYLSAQAAALTLVAEAAKAAMPIKEKKARKKKARAGKTVKAEPESKDAKAQRIFSATCTWAASILQEIGGERSMETVENLAKGDYMAIGRAPFPKIFDYRGDLRDIHDFARDYAAYNLLRKYADFPLDIDRVGAALSSFHESESRCRRFNDAGEWNYPYVPGKPLDVQVTSVLYRARDIIARILGRLDTKRWFAACSFTSGASTRLRRKAGDAYYKLQGELECTVNCRDLLLAYISCCPGWAEAKAIEIGPDPHTWVRTVVGSRYSTVKKDWKTERGISPQPEGNLLLQTGLGKLIRARLRRFGCTLNDQGRNQRLAARAFRDLLATLDLSQASDSVSLRLCMELLPKEWLHALLCTRAAYTVLPCGKVHRLEQMSSMGNGFTFELESLLFYSITLACCEVLGIQTEDVSVYGDDIIVPQAGAQLVVDVLTSCGFVINTDKSFTSGPFYESCGKHYYAGVDVTPFYIKESLDGLEHYHRLHNRARTWFVPLENVCSEMRGNVKGYLVPPDFPDTSGYWVTWDEACPKWNRREGAWAVKALRPRTEKHEVGSSSWGYLRYLLTGNKDSQRSITGYTRGGDIWCITSDNDSDPFLSVSNDVYRAENLTVHSWANWDFTRPTPFIFER